MPAKRQATRAQRHLQATLDKLSAWYAHAAFDLDDADYDAAWERANACYRARDLDGLLASLAALVTCAQRLSEANSPPLSPTVEAQAGLPLEDDYVF